jgi:hypothetical protein
MQQINAAYFFEEETLTDTDASLRFREMGSVVFFHGGDWNIGNGVKSNL